MIVLDALNSRMKDFYDIHQILKENSLSGNIISEAIRQTFNTRHTVLPDNPAVFSEGFSTNARNLGLWEAFLKRIKSEYISLDEVVSTISKHLKPIYLNLKDTSE